MVNNKKISVVIRFHGSGRLEYLYDALFSIHMQHYSSTEVIFCLQNCVQKDIERIEAFCKLLGFDKKSSKPPYFKIFHFSTKKDIRARLLNMGLKKSTGRYVCFLDYDDTLYGNAFKFHLENFKSTNAAVSVGGCRKATLNIIKGKPFYIKSKKMWHDKQITLLDEFYTNYIPLHSFMIDKNQVLTKDLYIDANMKVLEDYHLLLRLSAKYKFHLKNSHIPICEYRMRDDNSNTTAFFDLQNKKKEDIWTRERKKIDRLKKALIPKFSVWHLIGMD